MTHTRRIVLLGAAASAMAAAPPPVDPRKARPQAGDRLVFAEGDRKGQSIAPDDVRLDGEVVLAWPTAPDGTLRDQSRLNLIVLIRRDPATLDAATSGRATDGIVAYAATCSHAGCTAKIIDPQGMLLCPCHMSRYDPRRGAAVLSGPAPRPLPALALAPIDGMLSVAAPFTGTVGPQPG